MTRSSSRQLARFVVAGAVNTGLSYLAYLVLLKVVPYRWAYSVSYVAGIFLSFVLNSLYVFRTPIRWRKLLPFPSVYLVQYLLGLGVMYVGVELLRWDPRWIPAAVLAVTVPVSFVLTRRVLKVKTAGGDEAPPSR